MARFRGSPRGRTIVPRRLTSWEVGPGGTAVTPTSVAGSFFLGSAIQASIPGLTIVRIRGEFAAYLNLATSSLDGYVGAFGIGIASLAAVTAGVGSVPTPITESGADNWLYHRFFALKAGFPFSAGADPAGNLLYALRFEVDSKAMRKFETEQALYAIFEVVEVGTSSMQVHFDSRVLAKLP